MATENQTIELRQEKSKILAKMDKILKNAEDEERNLTFNEQKEFDDLDNQIDKLNKRIENSEKVFLHDSDLRSVRNPLHFQGSNGKYVPQEGEFRSLAEMLFVVANNPTDRRLMELREQTMGTGAKGGFAVPEQFKDTLLQVTPQEAIVRPRANVIPAGTPPDAKLTIPSLDQTSAQNMYGGVKVAHSGEGVTMTETDANFREVSLEPKEISAYLVVTDKLLNNWQSADKILSTQLRMAMIGQEEYDFLRGDGVNKSVGIINSAASIPYPRAGAGAIAFADVYNMLARVKMGGSPIWVASQTIIPQLATMVDAGNHAVWTGADVGGAAAKMPTTLMGFPLFFADRLPALGTKGDLCLLDLAYYLVKDGSGPFLGLSEHVFFTSNKTVFRIRWNVDAKPWLTEPIPIEGSISNTVSPFVILN